MDGKVSLSALAMLLGAAGFLALAAAFIWYYRQTGGQKALETALANYKSLAESRKAKMDESESEIAELKAELKERTAERDEAVDDRNKCAQENLRLLARQRRLERVVNELQRRCGMEVTDFEDPTGIHLTEGGRDR
jgi:chromosome segregation ATPase